MIEKVVLALLLVITVILVAFSIKFSRRVSREVKELLAGAEQIDKVITEHMLTGLPEPVQRYLRHSGIVGKPWIHTVHLKQSGQLKTAPQGSWLPFSAEEYFSVNPPRFFWHTWIPSPWIPILRGSDGYRHGEGQLLITLLSLFTVADVRSEEVNQGEMVRYLNEMMWFPTAFLGDNVSWEAIDHNSARVTLTDQGKSVSALMYVDEEGKLTNFIAQRYFSQNNNSTLETWEVPITAYGQMAGLNLPISGYAVWKLKDGDFKDIEVKVSEIEYNVQ